MFGALHPVSNVFLSVVYLLHFIFIYSLAWFLYPVSCCCTLLLCMWKSHHTLACLLDDLHLELSLTILLKLLWTQIQALFSIVDLLSNQMQNFVSFSLDNRTWRNHGSFASLSNHFIDSIHFPFPHICVHQDPSSQHLSLCAQPRAVFHQVTE